MSEQDELFEPDLIDRIANALPVEVSKGRILPRASPLPVPARERRDAANFARHALFRLDHGGGTRPDGDGARAIRTDRRWYNEISPGCAAIHRRASGADR